VAKYHVAFASSAEKELKDFPRQLIARLVRRLENLSSNPRPSGCKKLSGGDGEWRIRVGDYRVVYTIDDGKLLDTGGVAIIG
jgi:mRNA interferase RelE/StbE